MMALRVQICWQELSIISSFLSLVNYIKSNGRAVLQSYLKIYKPLPVSNPREFKTN
jgi:hypothetical protein